jgi:phosphoribosylanthranilate isomerase
MRIKVCGITRQRDAELAVELGASALGFVFWPASPRCVDVARARAIARAVSPLVSMVGVFVNQPREDVRSLAEEVGLSAIQLHGDERLDAYDGLPYRVIKAVAIGNDFDPLSVSNLPLEATMLLDAHDPIKRGGTGRTIDWAKARAVARARPVILSGGLTAGNVREAMAAVEPHGIDVSSGVESAPGVKDPTKLRQFFAATRG